jgi:hypothetical protein
MDLAAERIVLWRRRSHVELAKDPRDDLTTVTIRPTLAKRSHHRDNRYRWSGPWYSSTSAQQSRTANAKHATCSFAVPRKLHKRRDSRGLSNHPSVSATEPPGQRKPQAAEHAPRSCDSLELGASGGRLRNCDEFSPTLTRWRDQSADDDPWFAATALVTGIGGQGDLLHNEGVSRRLSVL